MSPIGNENVKDPYLLVNKKYLRNRMLTTTYQIHLKYFLQNFIKERLKYYAKYDYDILASDVVNGKLVKGNNEFLGEIPVLRSDPVTHKTIPAIGINKIQDNESDQFLGDQVAEFKDEFDKAHRQYGSMWEETLEIRVWSHNSDERDYIGHVIKYILFEARTIMAQLGVVNQRIGGGQDESDPVSYQPEVMFWTSFIFTGTTNLYSATPAVDLIKGIDLQEPSLYRDHENNPLADP